MGRRKKQPLSPEENAFIHLAKDRLQLALKEFKSSSLLPNCPKERISFLIIPFLITAWEELTKEDEFILGVPHEAIFMIFVQQVMLFKEGFKPTFH